METLVSDCFPPIFSYLSLYDLLKLRTLSLRLKQEVEDYLPNIRSLPLYLTTLRTPEAIAEYENVFLPLARNKIRKRPDFIGIDSDRGKFSFGTSCQEASEDPTILQNQNHFRRADFLILNHSSALSKFLPFIKKHCLNIEKLALVIDHCEHYLPEVSKVLEAFPAIKVLLLERTLQDSFRHSNAERSVHHLGQNHMYSWLEANCLRLPPEVFDSILKLKHLEELYFFSKKICQLILDSRSESQKYNFVRNLLDRLRVFHINIHNRSYSRELFEFPIGYEPEKRLEELACWSDNWLTAIYERSVFPKLKKFILLSGNSQITNNFIRFGLPSLEILDLSNELLFFRWSTMENLNLFSCLESFKCLKIWEFNKQRRLPKRMKKAEEEIEDYELEIVDENLKNRTIKHLQVMKGSETAEERNRDARRWSRYFVALETCTFLEPEYSVIQIENLRK